MKTNQLTGNFWMKNILIPLLLILPVLWFCIPSVWSGADNLRMIRHFDNDEAGLIEFSGKIYSQGLVPMNGYYFAYPQLFYYLAGLFLFPYTLFKGINYQMITIALRSLNVLSIILTVLFIYFFSKRFFKSIYIGILGCLLLVTTPDYMWWLVNSRPHPLEILFILVIFYFCFKLVEQYQPKYLAGAIIFTALATSIKYGGLFMIPVVWSACIFDITKSETPKLAHYLKPRLKFIYFISLAIILFVILTTAFGLFMFFRHQQLFCKFGINSLNDLLSTRNARQLIIISGLLIFGGFTWFVINILSDRFIKNNKLSIKYRNLFIINKSLLLLLYIIGIVIIIFVILNPTYWLFPKATFRAMLYQYALTSMGTNLDIGIGRAIFDSKATAWIKMFFDTRLLGPWIGLLFLCYIVYELTFFKKNWLENRKFVFQRILLWIYMLFLLSVLFIFVSHKGHHYLLPISIVMMLLVSFGVVELIKRTQLKFLSWFLLIIFAIFLSLGIYTRVVETNRWRRIKFDESIDTGVLVGNWLLKNFPTDKIIWKDFYSFYIPPEFNNVFYSKINRNIDAKEINLVKPDILILTSTSSVGTVELLSKTGKLPDYKQVKHVKYANQLQDFTDIYVLLRLQ